MHLLTPVSGSKNKYYCPVCNKNDFGVSPGGLYACYSGGCDKRDIRSAIDKLAGKPDWEPKGKSQSKKNYIDYLYNDRYGNPLAKASRTDFLKPSGEPDKKFSQAVWTGSEWRWKPSDHPSLKKQIPVYRYKDVQEAIAQDQQIFIVEGEKTADALWSIGIPATTTIGGSGGYKNYGEYGKDLAGARLILCPDRDAPGLKYISNFARDFNSQIEGYCLAGEVEGWFKPSDGRDLADDILDRHLGKTEILASVITVQKFNDITLTTSPSAVAKTKEDGEKIFYGFTTNCNDGLVWHTSEAYIDDEGNNRFKPKKELIGNHLQAIAYINNPDGNGSALHLEFKSIRGQLMRWTMPRAAIVSETSLMLAELVGRGYSYDLDCKKKLLEYLNSLGGEIETTFTVTDSTGWTKDGESIEASG